jgi:hypothetical protein
LVRRGDRPGATTFGDTLRDAMLDRIALFRLDGDLDRHLHSNRELAPRATYGFVVWSEYWSKNRMERL